MATTLSQPIPSDETAQIEAGARAFMRPLGAVPFKDQRCPNHEGPRSYCGCGLPLAGEPPVAGELYGRSAHAVSLHASLDYQMGVNRVLIGTTRRFATPVLSADELREMETAYRSGVTAREFGLELSVRDLVQRISDMSGAAA